MWVTRFIGPHWDFGTTFTYLFIFSLGYIEHSVLFVSSLLASVIPRVLYRVRRLNGYQLKWCFSKCFLMQSITFSLWYNFEVACGLRGSFK